MRITKNYFNPVLTARNCSRKGYYWVQDILFYDHKEYGTIAIFKESLEKGYKLGRPKDKTLFPINEDQRILGFYAPKEIVSERLSNIYNPLLSPRDAPDHGYVYVDDIIYHILQPNQDIVELIQEHGYKLGLAVQGKEADSYFGLYMPSEATPKKES